MSALNLSDKEGGGGMLLLMIHLIISHHTYPLQFSSSPPLLHLFHLPLNNKRQDIS